VQAKGNFDLKKEFIFLIYFGLKYAGKTFQIFTKYFMKWHSPGLQNQVRNQALFGHTLRSSSLPFTSLSSHLYFALFSSLFNSTFANYFDFSSEFKTT
jgi:hypothetical protein